MTDRQPPDCVSVQEALWPLGSPRPAGEDEAELREHIETCDTCRRFFARDTALARRLRRYDLSVLVPSALRDRWIAALGTAGSETSSGADHGAGRARRRIGALALAAGLAWLAVILVRPAGPEAAFAEDFMSREVEAGAIESPDPGAARAFFRAGLGVAITPVALDEARVNRAMICLIRGERAAMVEYRLEGSTIAHYRLPRPGGARRRAPATAAEGGVNVIRWADESFEHAVVSSLPAARLERLVREEFLAGAP